MSHPAGPESSRLLSPEEETESLLRQIVNGLITVVPPGWARIELTAAMTVAVRDLTLTVLHPNGARVELTPMPGLGEDLARLRAAAYRPGQGTWFSMRLTLDPPDVLRVSYSDLIEPTWIPPVPDWVYVQDLAVFPRDPRYTPTWLSRRLADANTTTPPQNEQA